MLNLKRHKNSGYILIDTIVSMALIGILTNTLLTGVLSVAKYHKVINKNDALNSLLFINTNAPTNYQFNAATSKCIKTYTINGYSFFDCVIVQDGEEVPFLNTTSVNYSNVNLIGKKL